MCFQTIIMLVQCHAQICRSIEQHLLSNWIETFDSEAMLQPHYLENLFLNIGLAWQKQDNLASPYI